MRRKRRIEITLETSQIFECRLGRPHENGWCPECATPMVSPEAAAAALGVGARAIYARVEEGSLHFTETKDGLLWICLASLQAILSGSA